MFLTASQLPKFIGNKKIKKAFSVSLCLCSSQTNNFNVTPNKYPIQLICCSHSSKTIGLRIYWQDEWRYKCWKEAVDEWSGPSLGRLMVGNLRKRERQTSSIFLARDPLLTIFCERKQSVCACVFHCCPGKQKWSVTLNKLGVWALSTYCSTIELISMQRRKSLASFLDMHSSLLTGASLTWKWNCPLQQASSVLNDSKWIEY